MPEDKFNENKNYRIRNKTYEQKPTLFLEIQLQEITREL